MSSKSGNGSKSASLITFPCDFNIKVMGKSSSEFVKLVTNIVLQHFPELSEEKIQKRYSEFTNYTSLTITVHAESQAQLDNLYRDLSSAPEILIVI